MSNNQDPSLRVELSSLEVPEHRTGFWADVSQDLDRGYEVVSLKTPQSTDRPRPWLWAVASAAAVALAFLVIPALIRAPETTGEPEAAGEVTAPSTTVLAVTPTNEPTPTTVDPQTQLPAAPWSAQPLAEADVARIVIEQWNGASDRAWCSALAPSEGVDMSTAGDLNGSDDFAVGWTDSDGRTLGIMGVGIVGGELTDRPGYEPVHLADGSSWVAYPEALDPSSPTWLADIVIPGQACFYQASGPNQESLTAFVESLRFVEGTISTTRLRTAADVITTAGGTPPWSNPPLVDEAVTGLADASGDVPLLGFESINDAWIARAANVGLWGVAWDAPDGPGHDAFNLPCSGCGRGVIGVGGLGPGPAVTDRLPLEVITWDDGSVADIHYRILDDRLPLEAALIKASEGGLMADGFKAELVIDGQMYEVWSHLGLDHLRSLLKSLRFVE